MVAKDYQPVPIPPLDVNTPLPGETGGAARPTVRRVGPSRDQALPIPSTSVSDKDNPIATNPMTLVPVAVLDDDPEICEHLASQLGMRAEPVSWFDEASERLTGAPLVIVLGPSCGSATRLAEVGSTLQSHREVGTVLVTDELSTDLLQTALRSGVNDVLGRTGRFGPAGGRHRTAWRRASTSVGQPGWPTTVPSPRASMGVSAR